MKYSLEDIEKINFRNAFPPMPEGMKKALKEQLNSFHDEKKVYSISFRPVLIAAIVIVLMTCVAYAATKLGWVEYFREMFSIDVTEKAQKEMESSTKKSFVVGPVTFTIKECFSDGRLLLGAADIQPNDGNGMILGDIDEMEATMDGPIYIARFVMNAPSVNHGNGEDMEDYIQNGSSLTYLNMLSVKIEQNITSVPVSADMSIIRIDPNNGKTLDSWSMEEELLVPVNHQSMIKEYLPETTFSMNGMILQSIEAEQTAAGIYLRMNFLAEAGSNKSAIHVPDFYWQSMNNEKYDKGINLSMTLETDDWPHVVIIDMISVNELPEEFMLIEPESGVSVLLEGINEG